MSVFKKLAGDTLIYGLGTIVPRLLNFLLLTPYYTYIVFDKVEYGKFSELYAYITVLLIILTFGLETGFFRFFKKDKEKASALYSSLAIFLLLANCCFVLIVLASRVVISNAIGYENEWFVVLVACIVGLDAFASISFAKLRIDNKALKFSIIKLLNVGVNLGLVYYFYSYAQNAHGKLFNEEISNNVIFVLIANLIASITVILLLTGVIKNISLKNVSPKLIKEVLIYSIPLIIAGLAGQLNEVLDRLLLKHTTSEEELGIYSAVYRISVFLMLFIQMFRYAVEPIYFKEYAKNDNRSLFAKIMRLFTCASLLIATAIIFYLHYIKFFIAEKYHHAINIVPIILVSGVLYGIFFNLSFWYKFLKKTQFATYFMLVGVTITVLINALLVPKYGYEMAAWAHVISYGVMVILSYSFGRKYYKVDYKVIRLVEYAGVATLGIIVMNNFSDNIKTDIVKFVILIALTLYYVFRENVVKELKRG